MKLNDGNVKGSIKQTKKSILNLQIMFIYRSLVFIIFQCLP